MESFTIQCTSCESRIRVRNPNMIGQIANCPKCGSMILIAAPQKITVESGNPTDSVAVTREALPPPDESLLKNPSVFETGFRIDGLPPNHSQNVDLAHSLPEVPDDEYRLAADPDLVGQAPVGQVMGKSNEAMPLGEWLPEPAMADTMPPPRTSDIDSSIQAVRAKRQESAAKSRHVMLVATFGLCSVLIAIGILVVFLRWIAKPEELAQNKPNVPANNPANPANVNPANANPASDPALADLPQSDQPKSDLPFASGSDSAATNPGSESTMPPSPPNDQVPATVAPTPASTGPSTVGNASATKSPLGGSIAPSLDSVLGPAQGEGQPAGDVPLELPAGLQGFSRMFNQGFEPALPDTAVPQANATKLPDAPKNEPANQPGAASDAPADLVPATVDKMLSSQLSGLLINQRRLSETLTTLSLVGDVPIVPDLDSLLVVGASNSTLVNFKATSAVTFDAVLKSISNSTKISLVPWDNRVIYARASDADLEQLMPSVLPIDDLVTDETQRNQLLTGLKGLLPELNETLQLSEGGLQLALTKENRLAWFQLARLLESWRTARGLANKDSSAIVPKTSLLPEWPVAAMQPIAKTQLKQVVPSEPIARTWQRLTAEARVGCWIDWYGLQLADVNPRQRATVIASGRTLGDVLQYYANKYQIVFAIEDARSIWITSPDMHRMQPRLFLLPIGEKTIEDWTAELETLAPVHPTTGASLLKLIPAPDGQYLFVQCCRPILVEPN